MKSLARTEVLCVVIALAALGAFAPAGFAVPKPALPAPSLDIDSATQISIVLKVTAGAPYGAPGGFVIHWATRADFEANGNSWEGCCDAGFSGEANLSRYDLGASESVNVNIGEFLFDSGANTTCPEALLCGTEYVFRAFAQATGEYQRSAFTGNCLFSTLACGSNGNCTRTQGYWKTHYLRKAGEDGYQTGLDVPWPATELDLGTQTYDIEELLDILNAPAAGNGLISLAHQLIAAKLNALAGADLPPETISAIADADGLIGGLVVPPVGAGYLAPNATSALTTALTSYNEGAVGPGHCDD